MLKSSSALRLPATILSDLPLSQIEGETATGPVLVLAGTGNTNPHRSEPMRLDAFDQRPI